MVLLTNVFSGRKYPTLLDTVGLFMPGRSYRGYFFFFFNVDHKHRICPSDGFASASNFIGSDADIYIFISIQP